MINAFLHPNCTEVINHKIYSRKFLKKANKNSKKIQLESKLRFNPVDVR